MHPACRAIDLVENLDVEQVGHVFRHSVVSLFYRPASLVKGKIELPNTEGPKRDSGLIDSSQRTSASLRKMFALLVR